VRGAIISKALLGVNRIGMEETYNWGKIADQTIKVYENALAK